MSGVLTGLRIVESAAFVAAPSAGMTLAQLGADVIRIDPLGGGLDANRWPVTKEGKSLYWVGLNKGKRSIRIDIGKPEGRELATALITAPGENAGLFLTNFPATGWLDYAGLKRRRGDLVMVNIVGDSTGRTALDYTVNAAAGFTFLTGPTDVAGPVNNVVPAWDLVTGQSAALGLIAAERHRRLTGEGQLVRIALSDVAFAAAGALGYIADVEINDAHRPHYGNDVFGAYGRDFATKDRRRLMLVAITRGQWEALKKATGLSETFELAARALGLDFAREGDRYEGRGAITAILERWFAARDFADARRRWRAPAPAGAPTRPSSRWCAGILGSRRPILCSNGSSSLVSAPISPRATRSTSARRHAARSHARRSSGSIRTRSCSTCSSSTRARWERSTTKAWSRAGRLDHVDPHGRTLEIPH